MKLAKSLGEEQSVTVILSTSLGDIELVVYP